MRSILFPPSLCALLMLGACRPSAPTPDTAPDDPAPQTDAAAPMTTVPAPPASAPAPPAPATAAAPAAEHWQCGEVLLDARLDGETLRLDFSGRMLALPHLESLTGARFADDDGNEFMRQADGAKLIVAGDEGRDCTRSDHVSPWIEAASRGMGFRAVGNEPGWIVEVGKGNSPALQATLDHGDRRISVAGMQPAGLGFSGKTADGTTVTLEIQRTRCQDGMSGQVFEATAQLVVGDKTYRGCGAFLLN